MKVASVVGVRPQFVNASVVSRELRTKHEEVLTHKGQHHDYQMYKIFFEQLNILELPVHPGVEMTLNEDGIYDKLKSAVRLVKSLFFLDFIKLLKQAKLILTDSGGIQNEAYFLKIPCITLRENTEWYETIEAGWNVLVAANKDKIFKMVNEFNPSFNMHGNQFGNGNASIKIASIIDEMYYGGVKS